MTWELASGTVRQPFADWQISGITRRLSSADIDSVTFTAPAQSATDAAKFADGTTIRIYRDGVQWFVGERVTAPAFAGPGQEMISYEFAGPWHWLDELEFQQPWYALVGLGFQTRYTSHVFLCLTGGVLLTAADQITRILQYAIDQGAPFAIGTIEGAVYPHPREERDITCAQAIRLLLGYLPDTVLWFDYSTTTPTIHCRPRSNLTAVAVEIPTAATQITRRLESVNITPRYDLVRPAVKITYEIRGTIDDADTFALQEDVFPVGSTGREFGALTATVDAQGVRVSRLFGTLEASLIQINSLDWWKARAPWMADARMQNLAFVSGDVRTRSGTLNLANHLISGAVADWMDVQTEAETFKAKVQYNLHSADGTFLHAVARRK